MHGDDDENYDDLPLAPRLAAMAMVNRAAVAANAQLLGAAVNATNVATADIVATKFSGTRH